MSTELKVALDHHIFVYQKYGGISRYFVGIAEHLSDHGINARVFAPIHVNSYLPRLGPPIHRGVQVKANRYSSAAASRICNVGFPLFASAWKPRVVHETYFRQRRFAPTSAAIILTVYDMIHEIYPGMWGKDQTAQRKRAAIGRADKIICISESTRRDLIRFYPEVADKAVVTLLGFDPNECNASPPPPRQANKAYILYVGLRNDYKNFSRLWDAYSRSDQINQNFDLVCAGGGDFSIDDLRRINAAGMEGSVRQVNVNDTQLNELYRRAAVFVYPSEYEGFGIPPLEAMAAGCPTIVSRSSSIPEVCGGASEYFDPQDTDELIGALEKVLFSSDHARQLIAKGTEQLQLFSWQKCAAETAAIYRTMA